MTCQLTCCKEQCRVTICVLMVREGYRHRHTRPDSTSACNRSTPESRKKSCECVTDLTGMKVLIDYRAAFARTKRNATKMRGTRKSFPCIQYILSPFLRFTHNCFRYFSSARTETIAKPNSICINSRKHFLYKNIYSYI